MSTRIGVLRGGLNKDFEISLKTGQSVLDVLHDNYDAKDVLVDRYGNWFLDGMQISPNMASKRFDLIFNCLHGEYGEDGKVQQILNTYAIPYTGSGSMQSAIAINRHLSKRSFLIDGFSVPRHETLRVSHDLKDKLGEIYRRWSIPLVVKPLGGSNLSGTSIVNNFADLDIAISNAFEYSNEIIIEEFVRGKSASCCVLENFRGEDLYTFIPIERVSLGDGQEDYIAPGRFSLEEKKEIQEMAKKAHRTLGLKHYSRSDFIVGSKKNYILKTSSSPNLDEGSMYSKALESVGSNLKEFTKHVVDLALS